jgi:pimeloyl-ACP methyl ester carboxylesterase
LNPFLARHKLFVLACDRPGYGGTPDVGSNIDYLDTVRALLASFGVVKFDVLGVSGGAPWAHLMASRFSEQTRSLQVVCGLSTYNRETKKYFSKFQNRGLWLRRFLPSPVSEALLKRMLRNFDPERAVERMAHLLDTADREMLLLPENCHLMVSSMKHARAQGVKGILRDSALFYRNWLRRDCDKDRLRTVPTFYYHGKRDRLLNYHMSEWMHHAQPHSRLIYFEHEGHYSLPFRQADVILKDIQEASL